MPEDIPKSLQEKIPTVNRRKAAAVLALVAGVGIMLGGYYLTTLWVTTSYSTGVSGGYIHGDWRIIPAGGSPGTSMYPILTCTPACNYGSPPWTETAKATFTSAANGTLALKITGYPQGKTLLTLEAPPYEPSLDGSGGGNATTSYSYEGGNTTVRSDFVLTAGTTYLRLAIVNNGTQPVNSTYASWSASYPVYSHAYGPYGWEMLAVGAFLSVAGVSTPLTKAKKWSAFVNFVLGR